MAVNFGAGKKMGFHIVVSVCLPLQRNLYWKCGGGDHCVWVCARARVCVGGNWRDAP